MGLVTRITVMGLMLVLVVGCAGQKQRKRADEALERGNVDQAARYYVDALKRNPKYSKDEQFMANYRFAMSRDAFNEGQQYEEGRMFEQAIEKYEQAMHFDSNYTQPQAALPQAKLNASIHRYNMAVTAADQGAESVVLTHLTAALKWNPQNAQALSAKASLDSFTRPNPQADALSQTMRQQEQARDWMAASKTAQNLVGIDPANLRARLMQHTAQVYIASSRNLVDGAKSLIKQKQLGQAVKKLDEALNSWPKNENAIDLKNETLALIASVDELYQAAQQMLTRQQWAAAQLAADKGLQAYPYHEGLIALRRSIHEEAARAYTARGVVHMAVGRLDDAAGAYHAALTYDAKYTPARQGLSNVYRQLGINMDQAGKPGVAVLYMHLAEQFNPAAESDPAYVNQRNKVLKQADLTLSITSSSPVARWAEFGQKLENQLQLELLKQYQGALTVQPAGQRYRADVAVRDVEIEQKLVERKSHVHSYTVQVQVANPRLQELRKIETGLVRDIQHERRELDKYIDSRRDDYRRNHPDQRYDPDHDDKARQRLRKIDSMTKDLDKCRHDIQHEPLTVLADQLHEHPYTVAKYTKSAAMTVQVTVTDDKGTTVLDQWVASDIAHATDAINESPAPQLGLPADPLVLPADNELADAARQTLGEELTSQVAKRLASRRLAELQQRAGELAKAGQAEQAMELQAQAALLMAGAVDAKAGQQYLDQLAKPLMIQAKIDAQPNQ